MCCVSTSCHHSKVCSLSCYDKGRMFDARWLWYHHLHYNCRLKKVNALKDNFILARSNRELSM